MNAFETGWLQKLARPKAFLRHPWWTAAGMSLAIVVIVYGFSTPPAATAASAAAVGIVHGITWRRLDRAPRWQEFARRRWWALPAAVIALSAVANFERDSDRVIVQALGASDKAHVTYGTPGHMTDEDVEPPWSKRLKGLHHGDVITLVVTNLDDGHVICRILFGRSGDVNDTGEGRGSVATCSMTFP